MTDEELEKQEEREEKEYWREWNHYMESVGGEPDYESIFEEKYTASE